MIIGITGGIGTGKSQVAQILSTCSGYPICNADTLAHEVYLPGTDAWEKIVEIFGRHVLDKQGRIDRGLLGAIVFSEQKKLQILSDIVHPPLISLIKKLVDDARNHRSGLIVDAALIYELGLEGIFDQVWVVDASEEDVVPRVARRSLLDATEVQQRIRAQLSPEEKKQRADVIISNNQGILNLAGLVEKAWQKSVKDWGNERKNV